MRVDRLPKDEKEAYYRHLENVNSMRNVLENAKEEAHYEGKEEGRAEGRAEERLFIEERIKNIKSIRYKA